MEYLCECEAIMSPDELHSVPGLLETYFSTQKTQDERGLKIETSGSGKELILKFEHFISLIEVTQ